MAKRMMFLVLLVVTAGSFCLAGTDIAWIPRVCYVDGEVSVQSHGDSGWSSVDVNLPMEVGDRVILDKLGLLELEVDDGSFIRLNQYSELVFQSMRDDLIRMSLLYGDLIIRVKGNVDYVVQTPVGEVSIQHRGLYRINAGRDRTVEVLVRDGKARFINSFLDRKITEEQRFYILEDGERFVVGGLNREDDFDIWSERRDSRYASCQSYSYLPRTISAGVYDLDCHGRWVFLASYGHCWVPTVYDAGWAPYRNGYWRHSPRWGWTWVSHDAWGWLPYHYGRWCFTSFGWSWIPGDSWGTHWWSPCVVRFGLWNGYVGWVPLGPGDHHDGYWWSHRNRTEINNYININNYYNLTNVRNSKGVTYVPADDFRRGRPVGSGVYSRNNTGGGHSRSDAITFQHDDQIGRQIFQRDRIVDGTPKLDPIINTSRASYGSRTASGDGAAASSPAYGRGGSVTVGRSGASGSRESQGGTYSGRSRDGGGTGGDPGTGNDTGNDRSRSGGSSNDSYDSSSRGRPGVSRGSMQDSSRSRSQDDSSSRSYDNTGRNSGSGSGSSRQYEGTVRGGSSGSGSRSGGAYGGDGRSRSSGEPVYRGSGSSGSGGGSYSRGSSGSPSGGSSGGGRSYNPPPSGGSSGSSSPPPARGSSDSGSRSSGSSSSSSGSRGSTERK